MYKPRKNSKQIISLLLLSSLSSSFLLSCSGGNPVTPNTGSLTNLAQTGNKTETKNEIKKINITGRIVDSVTRKPIDNAKVLLHVISDKDIIDKVKKQTDDIIKQKKEGAQKEPDSKPSPSPLPDTKSSPESSVKPESSVPPNSSQVNLKSINYSDTIVFNSKSLINVLEENEEELKNDKDHNINPFAKKSNNESDKVETKEEVTSDSLEKDEPDMESASDLSEASEESSELEMIEADESDKEGQDEEEIESEESFDLDLTSSLTGIKLNNINEFKTTTGNDGKFWINEVPDSSTIITVTAKGYRTFSIFNFDTSKVEDIVLTPINKNENYIDIGGKVISVNGNPVQYSNVSASFELEDNNISIPANSNENGDFNLQNVKLGKRTFLATTFDKNQNLVSMGIENLELKEPKEGEFVNDNPLIKVRSITDYISLKGEVKLAPKTKLSDLNVYINFKKKGESREEIFFFNKSFDPKKKDNTFEIDLPKLDKGYSYHLEFSSKNKKGGFTYSHLYKVYKTTEKMEIDFLNSISSQENDIISREDEIMPVFSWEPVEKSDFYRISLNSIDTNNKVENLWEGLTPFNTAIYPINTGEGKLAKEKIYYWNVSAIKVDDKSNKKELISFKDFYLTQWKYLVRSKNTKFSLENLSSEDLNEQVDYEIDVEKEES